MGETIRIDGQILDSINFSLQQNYVPVIRRLNVKNESEELLEHLTLKVSFEPDFSKNYECIIERLEPCAGIEISPVRILLSTEYLFSLTERVVGVISIAVTDASNRVLGHLEQNIELLAFDQWSGLGRMPEMISAFVTPNHPCISTIIHRASEILKQWNNSSSFTGYQTQNPNQVKLQMAAVYAALHSENIIYVNPPASYEELGQRIRLPHILLEQKQGTCLDLAILYSSCLEAVGIHPLLVFKKGHAFAGGWLEEQTFSDCALDDGAALEKRVVEGAEEILLVECTDFVEGKGVNFETAILHGKGNLLPTEDFDYVVDVMRCRVGGIRPIPVKLEQAVSGVSPEEDGNTIDKISAPEALTESLRGKEVQEMDAPTRMKVWERKLLDLSLRNTLLNFRANKGAVQLMTTDGAALEDHLADGEDFLLVEIPSEWTATCRDAKMYEIETDRNLVDSISKEEMKNHRIRTFLNAEDLDKNLKKLQRAARVSLEENGSNTLYLANGFLKWYESDISEKARYAPLIMIPVDLIRNNRSKGYVIRGREEEPQINITLLEYLRQDHGISIGGLDPLPCDEHGVDLPLVFHTIRQAIMGKKRWNIENVSFIGLFSFGQFVMWNDLRNRSKDLLKNKVVSSLMEGRMNWTAEELQLTPENLEEMVEPESLAVPLSADSSQMVAIVNAAKGQSFVLHGPPGTGKSQTITNMIANALYQGKSVLFVAEKMAALTVVQKRLAKIGLDPFCLELHSNKTNKSSVLGQLNKALELGRIKKPEEQAALAEQLKTTRKELNYIMEAIHSEREFGCSLYQAISNYEQNISEKDKIKFTKEELSRLNGETIGEWMLLLDEYEKTVQKVGEYNQSPWVGYEGTEYSMELREELSSSLKTQEEGLRNAKKELDALLIWSNISSGASRKNVDILLNMTKELENPAPLLKEMLEASDYEQSKKELQSLLETGKNHCALFHKLQSEFDVQVFQYPVGEALLRWKQAQESWVLPKLVKSRQLLKEMKLYAKNPGDVTLENLPGIYEELMQFLNLNNQLHNISYGLRTQLGAFYREGETDWNLLTSAFEKSVRIENCIKELPEETRKDILCKCCSEEGRKEAIAHGAVLRDTMEKLRVFTEQYCINTEEEEQGNQYLTEVADTFTRFRSSMSMLKNWVYFNRIEKELAGKGLSKVVDAYHEGVISGDRIVSAVICNLYFGLSVKTIMADEKLNTFRGEAFEHVIERYDGLLEEYQRVMMQEIVADLSAKVPNSAMESSASSEMGILKKAIKSNGRMMSIRKLFDQIPTLLRKLAPCMLMSPISVAQYIDPKFPRFDLVIFDEASQLETSEAVGTIARGENVVVVGDPKQLPPTSFFTSNRSEEENYENEDLESLLDDCLAISMPQEYLKWHYRSRHESLIAYSNAKYYENKLYTFPSPNDLISEVKLVPVEGCYDKGKTKQNRAEAEAVVAEIIRRLEDKELQNDSIGVVTFSSVQQNLIEDMLLEEFSKRPELADWDANSKEPVFIKNLENVQGDERDVILFSIGYGPDANGKVSMNFGPLNQEGGWRRLNVAITRARKGMIVYAVIRPEQIDLSRTRSEGVAGLKGFLEYAQRGKRSLTVRAEEQNRIQDGLVEEIAGAIESLGYSVKTNIGFSKYKLDIGIVHPKNPETYLLGVMLDGENSRNATRSKDRYVLQPGVLKGLGWNTMRIWSLDWLDDSGKVLREIERTIQATLEKEESNQGEGQDGSENSVTAGTGANREAYRQVEFEKMEEIPSDARKPYETVIFGNKGSGEDFYDARNLGCIRQMAVQVIISEAPVSRKLLVRKILAAFDISRSGSRVENVINDALSKIQKSETKEGEQIFYWRSDQTPDTYEGYRVEDQLGNRRSMDEIPVQEILNAVCEVLKEQVSLAREDLVREAAKKFGYTRMGSIMEKAVEAAIVYGMRNGRVLEKDGKMLLPEM